MQFDIILFQAIHGFAGKSALLDFLGIFFAEFLAYILIAIFLFFLFLERNWKVRFYKFSLAALAIIFSRGIVTEACKAFYLRPRPPEALGIIPLITAPDSASFPSGHAAVFFALAAALFFLRRPWGLWFFGAATLIGIARVFVGVHFPSDILGGAIVGVVSALVAEKILKKPLPMRAMPETV